MDNENLNGIPQGTGPADGVPADGTQVIPPVVSGPDVPPAPPAESGDTQILFPAAEAGETQVIPAAGGEEDGLAETEGGTKFFAPPETEGGTRHFTPAETGEDDVDVDQILSEARDMAGMEPPAPPKPPAPFRDDEYRDTFGEGEELEAVFNDDIPGETEPEEEEEDVEPETKAPPRKVRPKMKKGYGFFGLFHLMATGVWLMVMLVIGVTLGRVLWVCAADVLAFGKEPMEAQIVIQDGDDMDTIAQKLGDAGLIKYPWLFSLYMDLTDNEVAPGEHQLSTMIYDYHAIKTALEPRTAARETVKVLIPEGYTCAQIFALLEEKGVCSVTELEEYAANGNLNEYWFLEGVERGHKYCLEGYLFPDTYQFYKGHDPELVLEKMLDTFNYRFTDIMKAKLEPLNKRLAATLQKRGYGADYIEAHKITMREIVIIASMIERETARDPESFEISSVIYNRLTNPGNFPYLNIDATVIYGLGGKIDPITGESIPLTKQDLETDTPYNTYTRKGLIPGPISNPGRNSINAALDPNETSYYYYVYNPETASHLFASTAQEHENNVNKVRNQGN